MTGSKQAISLRERVVGAVIRHGGWPLSTRGLERLRNFATYGLGAGGVGLPPDQSGELELLKRLARTWSDRDEVTVFDVGANRGEYAAAVRSVFGNRAVIHCFEPSAATFAELGRQLGADVRTQCHQLALGASPGTAWLYSNHDGSPIASLHRQTFNDALPAVHSEEVNIDTLDRVAERLGVERIDLLKLDVEGHELAVLEGAQQLLEAGAVMVVQFEFGERNLASRTYLRDFFDQLGPDFSSWFRLSPRGIARFEYAPACEVFFQETNYVAARGAVGDP